jgi:8-oxo-dGTP pyrophosphatase MutT (NUDIX family)
MSTGSTLRTIAADRLRSFTPTAVPLDGRRHAAVAIVLVATGDIWLTRRAPRMRTHAGQFALPGGGVDEGEDAVDAALRELREELGVVVPHQDVLGVLDDYPTRSGYVITPVVAWSDIDHVPAPNPAEVAAVHRISLRELDVEPRFVRIPESDRPVIQLPLAGRLVHAPTGAVLYQFREIVLHDRHTEVSGLEQPLWAWR